MKKLVGLCLALILLVLASPAVASPFCWTVEGTTCAAGQFPATCTDACSYTYTCECIFWNGHYVWDCPEVC